MQRAIIFYIRGSRIEINHITFFSAGVSWRLENPNMLQGPGFSCRKPLMQFQETNPPLYHPVTAWLTLRSLHCVCDSYNRTHVLIKDGHEATSACHSSIPRCKNCFQSPSLNKPKTGGCGLDATLWISLYTHPSFLTWDLFPDPEEGFGAIIRIDAPVKAVKKKKLALTIEFSNLYCKEG